MLLAIGYFFCKLHKNLTYDLTFNKMRKYFFVLIFSLISFVSFSQTNNLPPSTGNFTIYKNNPVTFTFNFPEGYTIPSSIAGETWDTALPTSQKLSVTPSTNISGQSITLTYSSAQLKSLGGLNKFLFYLIFNHNNLSTRKYVLGGQITLSAALGNNNTSPNSITIPDIGEIKVNLLGESSLTAIYSQNAIKAKDTANLAKTLAQAAQSSAQTQASISVNAAQSAVNTVKSRNPYGTIANLRAIPDTSFKSYNVIDKGKEGTFIYTPGSFALDDSSMVIISGTRRYVRSYDVIKPEYFGANPDDNIDDAPAIQKALNYIPSKGGKIIFGEGKYYIGSTLNLKSLNSTHNFRVTLSGSGVGKTIFYGASGFTGDIIYINSGTTNPISDNFIIIERIEFDCNSASRAINATRLVGAKFFDNIFLGGDIVGVEIGTIGGEESYSVYFERNYFGGIGSTGKPNQACLRLNNARFFEVRDMETDNGLYGIHIRGNSDKNKITGGKIEGAKKAAIRIEGSGGGNNVIENVHMNPYGGEGFTGTMSGMEIQSVNGSNNSNVIQGNTFNMLSAEQLQWSGKVTKPVTVGQLVQGQTTMAYGFVNGYNSIDSNIVISKTNGNFIQGEKLVQQNNGDTTTLQLLRTNIVYGLKLAGNGGYNLVQGNIFKGLSNYGVFSESDANVVNSNLIESKIGVYNSADVTVTGNNINSPGGSGLYNAFGTVWNTNNRIAAGAPINAPERYLLSTGGSISGNIQLTNLPVYADNTAAASLPSGSLYRTSTGEIRVKY